MEQQTIKSLTTLLTRLDERIQLMMKKQDDLEKKLEALLSKQHELDRRLMFMEEDESDTNIKELQSNFHRLEIKVQEIDITSNRQETRWKGALSFVLQLAWVILASYLLLKLKLQSPAVP